MDFLEAVRTRRSVRKYADRPVEEEKLHAVMDAVRMSPSWANFQCWRIVVVKDRDTKAKISELSYVESFFAPKGYKANPAKKALAEAPVVVVLCADTKRSGTMNGQEYYLVDAGIAAQSLMLAARAEGLGTVFVGVYDEEKLTELLGIPADIRIVGLIPLGYAVEEPKSGPPRIKIEEFCHQERW